MTENALEISPAIWRIFFPLGIGNYSPTELASDENGLPDMDGLVKHLSHRQMLEIRICKELFPDNSHIWKSKKYEF